MTDRFTVRMVVAFLGVIALAALGLGGYLAAVGREVPDFIIGTTAGSLSAIGALLAKTSSEPPVRE